MPRDNRISRLLHVLIHMDRHVERPTSEQISKMLGTNPVVVRRMMSGLRSAGIVSAERGQNGGWVLNRSLSRLTLLDVYEALGAPSLFNVGPGREKAECYVEQAVDQRVKATLERAEAHIRQQFSEITVEDIARDFESRMASEAPARPASFRCSHR
ncbi:DNA-binding protein [Nitratireductor aquibiodomus RA22]|uniref:Transcriptional regulator, BadM/Rrf2 family n=2 Tax=Nitratireductor aquibiodomus TaxID=204799 RepID=A0A1H4JV63_9HYPH|nr:Rrf2 family transcriptional regulator [Nitratireductor aquibiodomus]EIM76968.1 DNA-binding protein [Nitratireductor aquibiodomus RA22]SEB49542.1 transcriptional regulator, BadM/Rrf2 family [Nitratireductor aquibiodomus]